MLRATYSAHTQRTHHNSYVVRKGHFFYREYIFYTLSKSDLAISRRI